jgi:hypothetical protein
MTDSIETWTSFDRGRPKDEKVFQLTRKCSGDRAHFGRRLQ